jgi:LPS-assembly protein
VVKITGILPATPDPGEGVEKREVSILAAAIFLSALNAAPTAAAEAGFPGEPIVLHALSLERDLDTNIIVGEGAVDLTYGDLRLRADRVVIREREKTVIAEGNVILDEKESRLQGEYLELNLDTRTGFMTRGHGFAQDYFFTGERIEKLGPDRYQVLKGSFTTCEGSRPAWMFKSSDTIFKVDDKVTARHPRMYVKKVPVLYLPYATFPLERERASGLLIPYVRYNEIDGWIINNAFYWAPRDNFDATLSLNYRENVGWGPGLEARYITAPGTFGKFDGHYLDERDGGNQWKVTFDHQHALPRGIRGQVDLYFLSDRDVDRRFGDELETQATQKITSSFSFSKSWFQYDIVFRGLYEESLITERESTLSRLPELTIDRTESRLFDTGLFWRFSFEAARLRSENVEEIFVLPGAVGEEGAGEDEVLLAENIVTETNRVDILPVVSWPKSLGSWGSLTPAFTYRGTFYSEDLEGESHTRMIPAFDLALDGPRVYRIFDPRGRTGAFEKFKHLIEPRVTYVYVPEEDQSDLPQFDLVDFVPSLNTVVYSLTNTILGKTVANERGKSKTRSLLRVKLAQSYDFDALEVLGETRPFSPLRWDVTSRPSMNWDLRWKGGYDFYDSETDSQDLSLTWTRQRVKLRGEWRSVSGGSRDFVDLWARFPMGNWFWDLRSRYNVHEEEFIENAAAFKYTSQCWDISAGVVQWPGEYEFRFQLGLKGIGTVLNF